MSLLRRSSLPRPLQDSLTAYLRARGVRRPRVLAWARAAEGAAVGTVDRLLYGDTGGWREVWWHRIERGGWDQATATLRWTTTDPESPEVSIALADPGLLPELFRERVEQTIVLQRVVDLGRQRTAVVGGRRPLGGEHTELEWSVTPGRGVDLSDPATAAQVAAELERVRDEWAF